MKQFWEGFEKRAIGFKMNVDPDTLKKLEDILKNITGNISHTLPTAELDKLVKELRDVKVTHLVDPVTLDKLKDLMTHSAQKAQEVKKFSPRDFLMPALVGSAALGIGGVLGKRLGNRIGQSVPGLKEKGAAGSGAEFGNSGRQPAARIPKFGKPKKRTNS